MHDIELDRLADKPAQQHLELRQDVVELQRLRSKRLAARERQQLPHQTRRPVGVLLDLHDVLKRRIGRAMVGEQEVGIADDGGQHVVEVMRDAARELADRLHLLALREVLLQRALLGRVERENDRVRSFVAGRIGGRDEEARRTGGARALERHVERRNVAPALNGRVDRGAHRRVIALGDDGEDRRSPSRKIRLQRVGREPHEGGVWTQ